MKGSDVLFSLIKANPDKKFILIGQIIDKDIKEEVEKAKHKNLLWLEHKNQTELVDYYNASDLCVFPSRVEGNPLVPREAMACGVPSIISDIPSTESFRECIKVSINADKMNKAMNEFINLPEKEKKALSIRARRFIVEEYDDDAWKKRYLKNFF